MGTTSGVPSSFNLRLRILPVEVETIALLIGTLIFNTSRLFSKTISALVATEGTVLFAINAITPISSRCFLLNPVTSPLSSIPRYSSPPFVLAIAVIASTKSLSG